MGPISFKNIFKSKSGFSLVEVMIALTLFALFITAFSVGFGTNVQNSARLDEEYLLHRLTEQILNQIVLQPPEFSESLTLTPETKTFEETQFNDYEYTIEYKRIAIPDLSKIQGQEEQEGQDDPSSQNGRIKAVFDKLKENLENIVAKQNSSKYWVVGDIPKKNNIVFVKSKSRIVKESKRNNVLLTRDPVKINYGNGQVKLLAEIDNSVISKLQDTYNFVPNIYCSLETLELLKEKGIAD